MDEENLDTALLVADHDRSSCSKVKEAYRKKVVMSQTASIGSSLSGRNKHSWHQTFQIGRSRSTIASRRQLMSMTVTVSRNRSIAGDASFVASTDTSIHSMTDCMAGKDWKTMSSSHVAGLVCSCCHSHI